MIDPVRSDTAKLIVSTVANSQKKALSKMKVRFTIQRHSEADQDNGRTFSKTHSHDLDEKQKNPLCRDFYLVNVLGH
jgi:hypothetical protein